MMTRIKRIPLICSLFLGLNAWAAADSLLSKQSLAARQALQQVGMAGDKYRGRCTKVLLEGGENANKGIDFESVLGESSEPVVVTEGPSSSFSDHCGGAVVMAGGGEDEAKQKEWISKLRSR